MYTRKDYLNKKCTHNEYYNQFVSSHTIDMVVGFIGAENIINSNCDHFNDIDLGKWDSCPITPVASLMLECGDSMSLSGRVCIAKEAARIYKNIFESKAEVK